MHDDPAPAPAAWWEQLLELLATLFGNSSRAPMGAANGRRPRRAAGRAAPEVTLHAADVAPVPVGPGPSCDLFLLTGTAAIPLFQSGPTDPLAFFQRRRVPEDHEVEYVVRCEGGEPEPWAVLRLRDDRAITMADPQRAESFWRDLYRATGLSSLPHASTLTRGLSTGAFDLAAPDGESGRNVLACTRPDTPFKRVAGRRYTHGEALAFVRDKLRGVHLITWIEEAFPRKLPAGEVVHRYYLDRGNVYLVRHHWAAGKALFLAQPSQEALPLMASQALRRAA